MCFALAPPRPSLYRRHQGMMDMSKTHIEPAKDWPRTERRASGWDELWLKEDWWAIWLGLGIVLVAYLLFVNGSSLSWIAVTPAKWSNFGQLGAHFARSEEHT